MGFEPVEQTGNNCKTVAITNIDKHFARAYHLGFFPLHKKKQALLSTRELAKRHKSLQGELLQINQVDAILHDLGYETEEKLITDYQVFQATVKQALDDHGLIFACFAVDSKTALPVSSSEEWREHAAIIHACRNDKLIMAHWGKNVETSMMDFFNSNQALVAERQPEYYVKSSSRRRKYDLLKWNTLDTLSTIKPQANSGFKAKLLIVQPKPQEAFCLQRLRLVLAKIKDKFAVQNVWQNLIEAQTLEEFKQILYLYLQSYRSHFFCRMGKMVLGSLFILLVFPLLISWFMHLSIIDIFFRDVGDEILDALQDHMPLALVNELNLTQI